MSGLDHRPAAAFLKDTSVPSPVKLTAGPLHSVERTPGVPVALLSQQGEEAGQSGLSHRAPGPFQAVDRDPKGRQGGGGNIGLVRFGQPRRFIAYRDLKPENGEIFRGFFTAPSGLLHCCW